MRCSAPSFCNLMMLRFFVFVSNTNCHTNKSGEFLFTLTPRDEQSRQFVLFGLFVRRRDVHRKGWSTYPTPAAGYSVIRGPRPPAEQWPRASISGRIGTTVGDQRQSLLQRNILRSNPDEVQAAAPGQGRQVGRGIESFGRRRFDGSSRFASSSEGCPPRGTGPASCSSSRGMPSIHPTFTEAVGKVGRGTGEGARGVGRRPEANGRNGPGSANNHTACVRNHTARTDRSCGRARTSEGTSQRDGDRVRGGSEETLQIFVGAISRPRWWARFVVARLGRSARRNVGRGKGAMRTLAASSNRFSPLA